MSAEHATIQLRSERTPKIRTGLYIEEALLEQIRGIAEHNEISVNESVILLIKRGLDASQENEKQ